MTALVVEVGARQEFLDYWSACLTVSGVKTSFGCSHNHKTKQAAWRCISDITNRAGAWLFQPDFTDTVIGRTSAWGEYDVGVLHQWQIGGDTCRVRYYA